MTVEELNDKLVKHSPFSVVGRNGSYSFDGKDFIINGVVISGYKICSREDRHYRIRFDNAFYTMHNYQVVVEQDAEFPVTINYEKRLLKENKYRDKNAVNGFFVLQSAPVPVH